MADKLIANIHTAFDVYTHNTRPFLSKVVNHAKGIEPLDQDTLESLLEQASTHTINFQQDFEVNYYTLLKVDPNEHDISLTALASSYELLLSYVGIVFAFALESNIDIDDYPVLRTLLPLMKGPNEKLNYGLNSLEHFLARTQPIENTLTPVDNSSPPTIKAEVDNSPLTPQNPSAPVAPQVHPTIKVELDNSLPTFQNPSTPVASQDHPTIKAELDNSLPTSQNPSTPIALQDHPTIKAELDNSLPTSQNPSTPIALQDHPTIKTELDNITIDIKAEIDMDSQPMEIETLYDPDMDMSDTSYDNETDSNYDPSNSDYSDFEDNEGDFLEAREREYLLAYGNIWKHIPSRRHIDPFG